MSQNKHLIFINYTNLVSYNNYRKWAKRSPSLQCVEVRAKPVFGSELNPLFSGRGWTWDFKFASLALGTKHWMNKKQPSLPLLLEFPHLPSEGNAKKMTDFWNFIQDSQKKLFWYKVQLEYHNTWVSLKLCPSSENLAWTQWNIYLSAPLFTTFLSELVTDLKTWS